MTRARATDGLNDFFLSLKKKNPWNLYVGFNEVPYVSLMIAFVLLKHDINKKTHCGTDIPQ